MTKKKLHGSVINNWFRELDAVIRHETLSYIVDRKAIEEGNLMWDGIDFINTLIAGMDCASNYIDALIDVENDEEMLELESLAGSLSGIYQAERFLEEKDFLIQVMDSNELEELSFEAQYRLTVTYPLAKETVKHYLKTMSSHDVPSCLRSSKLNEEFRINDLWHSNDLVEIVKYHTYVLDRVTEKKSIKREKPSLVTSIKRNRYIDIYPIKGHNSLELITNYKWDVIKALNEPYRTEVLVYCSELINTHMHHLSCDELTNDSLIPDSKSLPIPPPEKLLVTRYDRYLPILIGLYCIKNEHRYKEVEGREWEVEFSSFRDFVEHDLFVLFECLRERYALYANDPKKTEEIDVAHYINTVLTRSIKASIAAAKKEVDQIEMEYFLN
ncbi:conserved hypothetical protein [Vibrio crassostreae]|nr:conserved hypothetical protein [Vibrio crassostreae]CAK1939802.1 conserved hypothetical protein [Vibrio crassostreae]CAK1940151.1 conserved hypothetical protein [Vibrio crassostreae]CAK2282069.1 conserved hypothetical protein [Vibrio crassostreae]CAK2527919.1 conserved hypothetical protein [Vibrio crassostreae]